MRNIPLLLVPALVASVLTSSGAFAAEGVERRQLDQPEPLPLLAAGVIVKTTTRTPSAGLVAGVASAVDGVADVDGQVAVGDSTYAITTDEPLSVEVAEAAAAEAEKRSDVVWAEPNYYQQHAANPPSRSSDPYFGRMKNLWDSREANVSPVSVVAPSSWPAGGFGTKAPSLWRATRGSANVVVAVVDTGVRLNHPDLAGRLVSGYDMVSGEGPGSYLNANDGDGRDLDPSDPGDWTVAGECGATGFTASSWHGTHVAGTVAANANSIGVVGVAPQVRVQPVRVLGKCGGTIADISAGIRWAAGLEVPGVPRNTTPAKVINVSITGSGVCQSTYQDAISAARGAGSVVVVAAGNQNQNTANFQPGNCAGAFTVASTSEFGDKAAYSNAGEHVKISAPGGDSSWGVTDGQIWSTIDSGTTVPMTPTYGEMEGTSMAAPAVSGAAALLRSLGAFTVPQLESALRASHTGFPTTSNPGTGFWPCDTQFCGSGILDLSAVQAPITAPTIKGTARPGKTLALAKGATWVRTPGSIRYQWLRDGRPIGNATRTSYKLTRADAGKKISLRVSPATGVYAPIAKVSSARTVTHGSTVSISLPTSVKRTKRAKVKVTVKVDNVARPTGKVLVYVGSRKVKTVTLRAARKGRVTVTLPKLKKGSHRVRVVYNGTSTVSKSSVRKSIRSR